MEFQWSPRFCGCESNGWRAGTNPESSNQSDGNERARFLFRTPILRGTCPVQSPFSTTSSCTFFASDARFWTFLLYRHLLTLVHQTTNHPSCDKGAIGLSSTVPVSRPAVLGIPRCVPLNLQQEAAEATSRFPSPVAHRTPVNATSSPSLPITTSTAAPLSSTRHVPASFASASRLYTSANGARR